MFFKIGEDILLLLDLPTVVLRLLVGHLYLELEVVQLLLLPLDLHAQLDVLPLQVLALALQRLVDALLRLRRLVRQRAQAHRARQTIDQLLALLRQHLDLHLLVDLALDRRLLRLVELGYAHLLH